MATPLNVALCGFGYAGRTIHAPLISAVPGLKLHTVVTSRPEDVRAVWPDARTVADLEPALADPAIDLVVIATPNTLHAPQARAALAAGKAVVIDKPFALDLAEAEDLAALADSAGRLLSVFHNRRWDADFRTVQAAIRSGRLGEVTRFQSCINRYRPEVRDRWRERQGPGAGLWHDLGPHLIDQALVLFGPPLAISADIAVQRDGAGAPDFVHATLRYERLRVILHADMLSAAPEPRFVVQGARAGLVCAGPDPQEAQLKAGMAPGDSGWGVGSGGSLFGADGESQPFDGTPGDWRDYYAAVAGAVRGECANPVPPDQALAVMRLIDAGLESSRRRCEMAL